MARSQKDYDAAVIRAYQQNYDREQRNQILAQQEQKHYQETGGSPTGFYFTRKAVRDAISAPQFAPAQPQVATVETPDAISVSDGVTTKTTSKDPTNPVKEVESTDKTHSYHVLNKWRDAMDETGTAEGDKWYTDPLKVARAAIDPGSVISYSSQDNNGGVWNLWGTKARQTKEKMAQNSEEAIEAASESANAWSSAEKEHDTYATLGDNVLGEEINPERHLYRIGKDDITADMVRARIQSGDYKPEELGELTALLDELTLQEQAEAQRIYDERPDYWSGLEELRADARAKQEALGVTNAERISANIYGTLMSMEAAYTIEGEALGQMGEIAEGYDKEFSDATLRQAEITAEAQEMFANPDKYDQEQLNALYNEYSAIQGEKNQWVADNGVDFNSPEGMAMLEEARSIIEASMAGQSDDAQRTWQMLDSSIPTIVNQAMVMAVSFASAGTLTGAAESISLALMGIMSAGQTTAELTEEQVNLYDAVARGIAAGAIEVVTEKIGMDAMIDFITAPAGSSAFIGYLRSAVSEGGEEVLSELMNWGVDAVPYFQEYCEQIKEEDPDAHYRLNELMVRWLQDDNAPKPEMGDLGDAFEGGFVSSLVLGLFGLGGNYLQSRSAQRQEANIYEATGVTPEQATAEDQLAEQIAAEESAEQPVAEEPVAEEMPVEDAVIEEMLNAENAEESIADQVANEIDESERELSPTIAEHEAEIENATTPEELSRVADAVFDDSSLSSAERTALTDKIRDKIAVANGNMTQEQYNDKYVPKTAEQVTEEAITDMVTGTTVEERHATEPQKLKADRVKAEQRIISEQTPERQTELRAFKEKVSKITDADVVITDTVRTEGQYDGATNTIYISAKARNPLWQVFRHELTHRLSVAKSWNTFSDYAVKSYTSILERDGISYEDAIDAIKEEYKREVGQDLTDEEAREEFIAKFVEENLFKNESAIDDLVRNSRSTAMRIWDMLRTWVGKLTGTVTSTDEMLIKAERMFSKALAESVGIRKDTGLKNSVSSYASACGLIAKVSNKTGLLGYYNTDGTPYHGEVTADHIRDHSDIGVMIQLSLSRGVITQENAEDQYKAVANLMNTIMKTQDPDTVWGLMGSNIFASVRSNADGQYTTTVDFSTVCRKTQDMIEGMSAEMVRLGRGLKKEEVIELQNSLVKEGHEAPCPVCYVFSRWSGIGNVLDNMANLQKKYASYTTEQIRDRIRYLEGEVRRIANLPATKNTTGKDRNQLKKEFIEQITDLLGQKYDIKQELQYQQEKAELKLKSTFTKDDLATLEQLDRDIRALSEWTWLVNVRSRADYKAVPNDILYDLTRANDFAKEYPDSWKFRTTRGPAAGKAILPYSDFRTGDLISTVNSNSAEVFVNDSKEAIDDFTKGKKQKVNRTFSKYQANRNDGELVSWWASTRFDPNLTEKQLAKVRKDQGAAFAKALARIKAQNFLNGQRYQSTSDFRYDYALDYFQSFFEAQALGMQIQTYTKVLEFGELMGRIGGNVNLSVMPDGTGYITLPDGSKKLVFSDITGINYEGAVEIAKKYASAQLILVGINDEHILLALGNNDADLSSTVGMVIPYHASGASADFVASLASNLGAKVDQTAYTDYSDVQNDKVKKYPVLDENGEPVLDEKGKPKTEESDPTLRNIRKTILTNRVGNSKQSLTDAQIDAITELADRKQEIPYNDMKNNGEWLSFEEMRAIEQLALNDDVTESDVGVAKGMTKDQAMETYLSWSADVLLNLYNNIRHNTDYKYYGMELSSTQAGTIMTNEYWNKEADLEHAYVNNFIFRSYCELMGMTPRFSGDVKKGVRYGDFTVSPGYWKTLIDIRMYDLDGNYRDQKPINISGDTANARNAEDVGIRSDMVGYENGEVNPENNIFQEEYAEARYDNSQRVQKPNPRGAAEIGTRLAEEKLAGENMRASTGRSLRQMIAESGRNEKQLASEVTTNVEPTSRGTARSEAITNTIMNTDLFTPAQKANMDLERIAGRDVVHNDENILNAAIALDRDYNGEMERLLGKDLFTAQDLDGAMMIAQEEALSGSWETVRQMVRKIRVAATEGGRFIQAFDKYAESAIGYMNQFQKYLDTLTKNWEDKYPKQAKAVRDAVAQLYGNGFTDSTVLASRLMEDLKKYGLTKVTAEQLAKKMVAGNTDLIQLQDLACTACANGFMELSDTELREINRLITEANKHGLYTKKRIDMINDACRIFTSQLNRVSWSDMYKAWRYDAMLTNVRTHVRNVVGNLIFGQAVVRIKDTLGAVIETVTRQENRTKAVVYNSALRRAAKADANEMYYLLKSNGDKYGSRQGIEATRRAYKNVIGLLNGIHNFNGEALELEDWIALKAAYANALSGWLKSNGYDEQLIEQAKAKTKAGREAEAILNKGREYAIAEAKRATFRDLNTIAQGIAQTQNKWANGKSGAGRAAAKFVEGVLPFKNTPANILARGIEYSPIGLFSTLTKGIADVRSGRITATQFIDRLSAGMVGSGIVAIGYLLAKSGLLTGKLPDEEKAQKEHEGEQEYSLNFGDTSYSIDWAAPAALPLFVGAAVYDAFGRDDPNSSVLNRAVSAFTNIAEPITEMSMLQGLNDILTAGKYAQEGNQIENVVATALTSYYTQGIPTLFGQVARAIDGTRRTTSSQRTGAERSLEYTYNKAMNKIAPGTLQPYIDIWGNTEDNGSWTGSDNFIDRLLYQMLSPGYMSRREQTAADKLVDELYDSTGDKSVFPKNSQQVTVKINGVERKLTGEQLTTYNVTKGKVSEELVTRLVGNSNFNSMDDKAQVHMLSNIYTFANEMAKKRAGADWGQNSNKWVSEAFDGEKLHNIPVERYLYTSYMVSQVTYTKGVDGAKSKAVKAAIDRANPNLTKAQKRYLYECFGVGKTYMD